MTCLPERHSHTLRVLVLLAGVLALPACAVVPGITAGDPGAGWYGEEEHVPPIERITPELIRSLAEREVEARAAPAADAEDDYIYRVGPGDVISVIVWEHPELTNPFGQASTDVESLGREVRRDGTLFFPYVGEVEVEGRTEQEIQRVIARGLAPYVQRPQVNVRVVSYRSRQVYVTGKVRRPGVQPITNEPLTVLDALSAAGGFPGEESGDRSVGADRRQAILTRDGESQTVDLLALYSRGTGNRVLQDGDILHVPDNRANKVFVMGEVNRQSSVQMHDGELSLAEAIAESEGLDLGTANTNELFVIRGVPVEGQDGEPGQIVPQIYQLDVSNMSALMLAEAFPLQPRDVVYASSSGWVRWNRVLNQVMPTISAAYQMTIIRREVRRQ